jgi:hypothetical protein
MAQAVLAALVAAGAQSRGDFLLENGTDHVADPPAQKGLEVVKIRWRRKQVCGTIPHGVFLRL